MGHTEAFQATFSSLGVSFFVLQAISYLVDVHNGTLARIPSWTTFVAYMSFFPHLLAGPICRAKQLIPQLEKGTSLSSSSIYEGIKIFSLGLFKKNVLANYLAIYVTPFFDQSPSLPLAYTYWMSLLCFTFEIYFDFSGYTQMAQGIAKLFGIDLPVNFLFPYTASSLKEFWSRWHISLSQWLRDYVYIPLGGGRGGMGQTIVTLGLTMLVSGAWHGLSLNYLLWAIYHWIFLSLEKLLADPISRVRKSSRMGRIFYSVIVFLVIGLGWVLFRTHTLAEAIHYYLQLFSLPKNYRFYNFLYPYRFVLGFLVFSMCFCFLERKVATYMEEGRINPKLELLVTSALLFTALVFRSELKEFIYFKF